MRMTIENDKGIYGFFGKYRPLSNYDLSPFCIGEITFPSGEHAFHYYKVDESKDLDVSNKDSWRYMILNAKSAGDAKRLGRSCPMKPEWDAIKLKIVYNILWNKFTQNEHLEQLLLSTNDKYLEETNDWNDTYWGVCNGIGQNNLGQLLMEVRDNIRITKI